jgi:hypothetical protein
MFDEGAQPRSNVNTCCPDGGGGIVVVVGVVVVVVSVVVVVVVGVVLVVDGVVVVVVLDEDVVVVLVVLVVVVDGLATERRICGADAPLSRLARSIARLPEVVSAKLNVPLPRISGVTSRAIHAPDWNGPEEAVTAADGVGAFAYDSELSCHTVSETTWTSNPVEESS